MYKGVNANVDFYSGLVYSMLDLPPALYTPIFAAARIVGWSAHRLEELKNVDKIIRPAYKPLAPHRDYMKLDRQVEDEVCERMNFIFHPKMEIQRSIQLSGSRKQK